MWYKLYSITKVTLLLGCLLARLLAFTKSGEASQAHQSLVVGRLVSDEEKSVVPLGLVGEKPTSILI